VIAGDAVALGRSGVVPGGGEVEGRHRCLTLALATSVELGCCTTMEKPPPRQSHA
jgi:hypothetical protein